MKKPKSCRECKYALFEKKTLFPEKPPCSRIVSEKITCELTNEYCCNVLWPVSDRILLDCPLKGDEVKE